MLYEISKEVFKQRLEDKTGFTFINIQPEAEAKKISLKDIVSVPYSESFVSEIEKKYPNKSQNFVICSFKKGDQTPATAARELAQKGHHFVYYYCGTPEDEILDKGIN